MVEVPLRVEVFHLADNHDDEVQIVNIAAGVAAAVAVLETIG
jgi:hypothetical protein